MSKKMFIALGAAILTIVGLFSSQANKKFGGITTAWYRTAGGAAVTLFHGISAANSGLTTVAIIGKTVFVRIGSGGLSRTLFSNPSLTAKAYSKH